MITLIIAFPNLVTGRLDTTSNVNIESIKLEAEQSGYGEEATAEEMADSADDGEYDPAAEALKEMEKKSKNK